MPTNVLGTELKCCCRDPITGFYRDGFCRTGPEDVGLHTVCVKVTRDFLDFSVLDGNDLVTPVPEWGFPGLKPGDKWCVRVTRSQSQSRTTRRRLAPRRRHIATNPNRPLPDSIPVVRVRWFPGIARCCETELLTRHRTHPTA